MKLLPVLLLNVLTVGAGIVIYDQVKSGDARSGDDYQMLGGESGDLESRVAALERRSRDNAPMLQSDGGANLAARIDELEKRLEKAPTVVVNEAVEDAPRTAASTGSPLPAMADIDEPTAEDVAKYRKLQEAARQQERMERERQRIEDTLARLEIDLSDNQKDKLATAYTDFQQRRQEVFRSAMTKAREARDAGGEANWGEVMTEARNTVQEEFTVKISSFIPDADAQKISESLNSRGGGRTMGMGGRRGR